MMTVSIVELYERTGTDPSANVLMPVTSNVDGVYSGEGVINMCLAMLLNTYRQAEADNQLHQIDEDTDVEKDKNWAKVLDVQEYINKERKEDVEQMEYAVLMSFQKGYIEMELWDGIRYFKPTEKCLNLDLYRFREDI